MERDETQLIARDRLTAETARRQTFPTVLRGLDRQAVEAFQRRTANELREQEREIADLTEELRKLREDTIPLPVAHPDAGHGGVDVLARATLAAEQIIADAQAAAHDITAVAEQRHEAIIAEAQQQGSGLVGKARQQAGAIVGRATQEAERDAARIRREAPAEAQRVTAHYTALAAAIRAGIISDLDSLTAQLQKWSEQARQGPDPASA